MRCVATRVSCCLCKRVLQATPLRKQLITPRILICHFHNNNYSSCFAYRRFETTVD